MERLMGTILKTTTNSRLGQIEITYLTNFYRIANLRALLDSSNFPPALAPFIRQLRSLYDPIPSIPETITKNRMSLDKRLFEILIARINELFPLVDQKWLASDKWDKIKSRDTNKFTPVTSQVLKLPNYVRDQIVFSTVKTNENNCIIAMNPNDYGIKFGIIELIFQHTRISPDKKATKWASQYAK
ncbi:hypothetical protein PCASD_23641 [Puccinia coronata f. sp. avenae]|uniref:Uncharacterized protein n=1 Tax=Puccinia coronata f. sp. avenae TaxID=200324 RepID=A0A2N5S1D2_9BASI|nr:hypothetical protein PCASD_23641 [Puccinia coronata f. sp. avenae]